MKSLWNRLLAIHRDEKGADMVEYILITAIIALPLVGILIWFKDDFARVAGQLWESVKGGNGTAPPP